MSRLATHPSAGRRDSPLFKVSSCNKPSAAAGPKFREGDEISMTGTVSIVA